MDIEKTLEYKLIKLIGEENYNKIEDSEKEFILASATQSIKNYCNRNDIPKAANEILVDMAIDVFRTYNKSLFVTEQTASLEEKITSVKTGDTSISFASENETELDKISSLDDVLYSYTAKLNKFRLFKKGC